MRAAVLGLVGLLLCADSAHAQALRVDRTGETMRIDGSLREWKGARFAELGSGEDGSMRYALASVDAGLYLAAEVRDQTLVFGAEGDALALTLALPDDAGGLRARTLWLFPGESGKTAARAELRAGRDVKRDARILVVEGPRSGGKSGYVIEAYAPWEALGADALWEQGRGSLALRDVDGKRAASTHATSTAAQPAQLPRLTLGSGQRDLLGSFLETQQLTGVEPRYDLRADVSGDARPERVVIIDKYLVVYGPGHLDGERSSYYVFPYGVGGGLARAELIDLTGDSKRELVVRVQQQNDLGRRTLWMALGLSGATIAPLLALEVGKERAGGSLVNELAITTKNQKVPRIDVTLGKSSGLDETSFRETSARDAQPILLPWGEVRARSYAWDGARFQVVNEQRTPAAVVATPPPSKSAAPQAEQPVMEIAGDPLLAFKERAGLPASAKPTRSLKANLLPGKKAEQIDQFGTQLVITGPEVGEGRGYFTYGLPVQSPDDVKTLTSTDLDGGAGDELLVRVRQPLRGVDGVERDLLLVLRGEGGGRIVRALLAEVARRQGPRAIENEVSTQKGQLVLQPGSAKGWSASSYPFDAQAIGGAERLLLPWSDSVTRYRDQGGVLKAVAAR